MPQAAQLEEEINSKKAKLDSKIATARKLRDQHAQLTAEVDEASDHIAIADSQHAYFQARLEQLLQGLPDIWANPSAANSQVVRYNGVVECRAAIEDYPRVRALLLDRLNLAETNLTDWEREHL